MVVLVCAIICICVLLCRCLLAKRIKEWWSTSGKRRLARKGAKKRRGSWKCRKRKETQEMRSEGVERTDGKVSMQYFYSTNSSTSHVKSS